MDILADVREEIAEEVYRLREKNERLLRERYHHTTLLREIRKDLEIRAERDSDGVKVLDISNFILEEIDKALEQGGEE